MMGDFSVFAVASNVAPAFRSSIIEALAVGAVDLPGLDPALIALDPELRLRPSSEKASKDDPVHRYGRTLSGSSCPLLFRAEARELLEDASKPRNAHILEDRSLAILMNAA
jgi:hypothetical protein